MQCAKGGFGFQIGQILRLRTEGPIQPLERKRGVAGKTVRLGDEIAGAPRVSLYEVGENDPRVFVMPERMLRRGEASARGVVRVQFALVPRGRRLAVRHIRESDVA